MPVLDTTFLIRLEQGDAAATRLLEDLRRESLIVPPWVVAEYLSGHSGEPTEILQVLSGAYVLVQTSTEWSLEAASFRRTCKQRGLRFRLPDFWIAVFARLYQTSVVTQNVRHFEALDVEVRTW